MSEAKKKYVLQGTKSHFVNVDGAPKELKPGAVVELTDAQAVQFGDKFVEQGKETNTVTSAEFAEQLRQAREEGYAQAQKEAAEKAEEAAKAKAEQDAKDAAANSQVKPPAATPAVPPATAAKV